MTPKGFQHAYIDQSPLPWPLGKAVCVGRNYSAHIEEMGHAVPAEPVLFMKPSTAWVSLIDPLALPRGLGSCHYETEIAVLIGKTLKNGRAAEVLDAVAGYGLALDLTLREVQNRLKREGLPWERAKGFDGSAPLTPLIPASAVEEPDDILFSLHIDGQMRQRGEARRMIYDIRSLIANISQHFTLLPGDVILTGTPEGVGPLTPGDQLTLTFQGSPTAPIHPFTCRVG